MKTLDEVIRALDVCTQSKGCKLCPYSIYDEDGFNLYDDCPSMYNDALHYLKEYRSEKAMWEADRKGHLDWIEQYKEAREKHQQAVIELKKNPPLTWDELKTMGGKPMWVEDNLETPEDITKYWAIMRRVEKAEDDEYALLSDFYFQKSQYGKDWQAYRKERE